MKLNYHTHTTRCGHARGTDEEYVLSAIENGFDVLGFCDHTPINYKFFYSDMRMKTEELSSYVLSVNSLKEKYKDKIDIKLGLECEFFPRHMDWILEQKEKFGIDYLILDQHFIYSEQFGFKSANLKRKFQLRRYEKEVITAINSDEFLYVAHPDLYMHSYHTFDATAKDVAKNIILAAENKGLPLEYNLNGLDRIRREGHPGYPEPEFWRLAGKLGATAIIGVDAHSPGALGWGEMFSNSKNFLLDCGLKLLDKPLI